MAATWRGADNGRVRELGNSGKEASLRRSNVRGVIIPNRQGKSGKINHSQQQCKELIKIRQGKKFSKSCCNMLGLSHMPGLSIIFEIFIRSEICAYLRMCICNGLEHFLLVTLPASRQTAPNMLQHRYALGQEYHHVMMKSQALQVLVLIQVSLLHLSSQGMELWVSPRCAFSVRRLCGWNDAEEFLEYCWNTWGEGKYSPKYLNPSPSIFLFPASNFATVCARTVTLSLLCQKIVSLSCIVDPHTD